MEKFKDQKKVSILEIGFGTGLNCFITYLEARKYKLAIEYSGIEAYPVNKEEINKLNYVSELDVLHEKETFDNMHTFSWNQSHHLSEKFSLIKRLEFFDSIENEEVYDLIYFDAFGARVQPELWTVEVFKKMFTALKNKGILVTYSARGSVRRAMQEARFSVERLSGPPGKREMLRATKRSV